MATGTVSVIMKFGTLSGIKTWTFNQANTSVTSAQVKAIMNTMIENGSIYKYPPLTIESAQLRRVEVDDFDLS